MNRAKDAKDDIRGEVGQNGSRNETPEERADRNMNELLQELRVVQAGVQILVAFLLSMSFTERFARIDEFQRWTYVVTLLMSMLTAGLLIAPAAVHRVTFRRGLKPEIVQTGHKLFSAGLATLVLTLAGGTLLVMDVAVGRTFAIDCAVVVGLVLAGLWFVLPVPLLRHQVREEREDTPDDPVDGPVDADADEPPPEQRVRSSSGGGDH
jgi:multisubunit Na+/H+ antiporter MnhE subunit